MMALTAVHVPGGAPRPGRRRGRRADPAARGGRLELRHGRPSSRVNSATSACRRRKSSVEILQLKIEAALVPAKPTQRTTVAEAGGHHLISRCETHAGATSSALDLRGRRFRASSVGLDPPRLRDRESCDTRRNRPSPKNRSPAATSPALGWPATGASSAPTYAPGRPARSRRVQTPAFPRRGCLFGSARGDRVRGGPRALRVDDIGSMFAPHGVGPVASGAAGVERLTASIRCWRHAPLLGGDRERGQQESAALVKRVTRVVIALWRVLSFPALTRVKRGRRDESLRSASKDPSLRSDDNTTTGIAEWPNASGT